MILLFLYILPNSVAGILTLSPHNPFMFLPENAPFYDLREEITWKSCFIFLKWYLETVFNYLMENHLLQIVTWSIVPESPLLEWADDGLINPADFFFKQNLSIMFVFCHRMNQIIIYLRSMDENAPPLFSSMTARAETPRIISIF